MKKVKVNLKNNSYKVIVGSNLVNEENLKILKNKEVLLVVDKNVPSQYKELITKQLINMSSCCQTLEIKFYKIDPPVYLPVARIFGIRPERGRDGRTGRTGRTPPDNPGRTDGREKL